MTINLNLSKTNVNRVAGSIAEQNTGFISLSPNPTSGQVTVSNSKFIPGNTYPLDVYNASGVSVFQKTMTAQQETISLSAPDGTYYVNLNTQDGLAVRKLNKLNSSN